MAVTPNTVTSGEDRKDFELLPAGVYLARCYRQVDEGTHTDTYPNQQYEAKPTNRVIFYWEILQDDSGKDIRMKDGRPFSIQKKYTKSTNGKATLLKDLNAWRGVKLTAEEAKSFDITKVLGKCCLLQVVHEEDKKDSEVVYANVGAIMSTTKEVEGVNEISNFVITAPDLEMFGTFSEKLQARINSSDELKNNPLPIVKKEEAAAKDETTPFDGAPDKVKPGTSLDKAGF